MNEPLDPIVVAEALVDFHFEETAWFITGASGIPTFIKEDGNRRVTVQLMRETIDIIVTKIGKTEFFGDPPTIHTLRHLYKSHYVLYERL